MESLAELTSHPATLAGIGYVVWEILKWTRNPKNHGLTEEQEVKWDARIVKDEENSKKLQFVYETLLKADGMNQLKYISDRQERILQILDRISENVKSTSLIMERILDKVNK